MSFSLRASGPVTIDTFNPPQTITLPSSYTTATGDCIIIAFSMSNANGVSFSGGGATAWDVQVIGSNQYGGMAIGWGCSAGHTSFTASATSGPNALAVAISVWSGLTAGSDPLLASQLNTSGGSSVTTLTCPALSYSGGQLVLGASSGQATTTLSPSWGNGLGNTNIALASSVEIASLDRASTASGTSTTLTTGASPSSRLRVVTGLFGVPSQGNMFLVL